MLWAFYFLCSGCKLSFSFLVMYFWELLYRCGDLHVVRWWECFACRWFFLIIFLRFSIFYPFFRSLFLFCFLGVFFALLYLFSFSSAGLVGVFSFYFLFLLFFAAFKHRRFLPSTRTFKIVSYPTIRRSGISSRSIGFACASISTLSPSQFERQSVLFEGCITYLSSIT